MRMRGRIVDIGYAGERLPVSIWLPDKASRAVVLMGHGLGVDRYHESNRIPAELLVNSGTTVIAPELPLHGDRAEATLSPEDLVTAWQSFWTRGGFAEGRLLRVTTHVGDGEHHDRWHFGSGGATGGPLTPTTSISRPIGRGQLAQRATAMSSRARNSCSGSTEGRPVRGYRRRN